MSGWEVTTLMGTHLLALVIGILLGCAAMESAMKDRDR